MEDSKGEQQSSSRPVQQLESVDDSGNNLPQKSAGELLTNEEVQLGLLDQKDEELQVHAVSGTRLSSVVDNAVYKSTVDANNQDPSGGQNTASANSVELTKAACKDSNYVAELPSAQNDDAWSSKEAAKIASVIVGENDSALASDIADNKPIQTLVDSSVPGDQSFVTTDIVKKSVEDEPAVECEMDHKAKPVDHLGSPLSPTESELTLYEEQMIWGTDINDLPVMRPDAVLPLLREDRGITLLYDVEEYSQHPDKLPDPYPEILRQNSHQPLSYHVRMPYDAAHNWADIKTAVEHLAAKTKADSADVEDCIKKYLDVPFQPDFSGLQKYMYERRDSFDSDMILSHACLLELVPKIARLAAELTNLCTRPIPLLKQNMETMVAMSQQQAACLLANAFFCTFPETASYKLVHLTFLGLFRQPSYGRRRSQFAKLDCIFNYFRRVTSDMPAGTLTFHRQVLRYRDRPYWQNSDVKLSPKLRLSAKGRIEKDAENMLHVDFANKRVGGGMLGEGCVQEEILFMLSPELNVSRLLTEVLGDNETLVITGCERFNSYSGYASSFEWTGDYVDHTARDAWGRHTTQLVAMDAQVLWQYDVYQQLSSWCINRELDKAYCGFRYNDNAQYCTVATGNWGCGAFGGDMAVKFLVQWMAASQAGRPMLYFTFDDAQLARLIFPAYQAAVDEAWTVGQLYEYMDTMAYEHRHDLSAELLLQGIVDPALRKQISNSYCVV